MWSCCVPGARGLWSRSSCLPRKTPAGIEPGSSDRGASLNTVLAIEDWEWSWVMIPLFLKSIDTRKKLYPHIYENETEAFQKMWIVYTQLRTWHTHSQMRTSSSYACKLWRLGVFMKAWTHKRLKLLILENFCILLSLKMNRSFPKFHNASIHPKKWGPHIHTTKWGPGIHTTKWGPHNLKQ